MKIIKPVDLELGGFQVKRVLPSSKQKMIGPWIFFDHIGPVNFQAGSGINIRPHPHINLATVTYLFDGEILHRDCLGNKQVIKSGEINLMIAGSGITHSERETEAIRNKDHKLHGLQLWHALPEEFEEINPEFCHYSVDVLPKVVVNGVPIKVMIGEAWGLSSPVKTFTKTLYAEAYLKPNQCIEIPQAEEIALYVVSGKINISGESIYHHSMIIFNSDVIFTVIAEEESQLAIIGGNKLSKRYIEWNFVSSRKERITKAKDDWKNGNFKKVIDDEDEYIPLPA